MVQLQILSGRSAGTIYDSSHLPLTIGRPGQADIPLDEPGVWPVHCQIHWQAEGLVLHVEPDALASVNDAPVTSVVLRNGDTITLGGAILRFGLSPMQQRSAALREWLTWIGLGALCLLQLALIYRLTH